MCWAWLGLLGHWSVGGLPRGVGGSGEVTRWGASPYSESHALRHSYYGIAICRLGQEMNTILSDNSRVIPPAHARSNDKPNPYP